MRSDNSCKMVSRIKKVFTNEVIKLIAACCDSKTIGSDQDKQIIIRSILKTHDVPNYMLGGATNRIVFFIDAYAYKIAINTEGYRDNLMEYAVSRDVYLQDIVTKSFETNGYILVAECVKALTQEDFAVRKREIASKLDGIATKYLFHDVGTVLKNHTNWGIRDNGDLVMLDYAYMHRATEGLFTCDHCGVGMLVYDATFSYLTCNNRSGCSQRYSYNERKTTQGIQVDLDRMQESKDDSIVLEDGESEKIISLHSSGVAIDSDTIVIETEEQYIEYLKEVNNKMSSDFDKQASLTELIRLATNGGDGNNAGTALVGTDIHNATVIKSGPKIAIMFDIDEIDEDCEYEPMVIRQRDDDDDEDDWTDYRVSLGDLISEADNIKEDEKEFIDKAKSELDAIDSVIDTLESKVDKDNDGIMDLKTKSSKGGEA